MWIEHDGSGMPVDSEAEVLVKFRDGYTETLEFDGVESASFWNGEDKATNLWLHTGGGNDIVAYRVIA